MLLAIAVACVLTCVLLAAQRLRKVYAVVQLAHDSDSATPPRAWAQLTPDSFENQLWQAWQEGGEAWQAERVDAVVFEMEHQLGSWKRMPRVTARVSSTVGFLLAAVLLRSVMADLGEGDPLVDATPLVLKAVQLVAVGLAGSAVCLAFGREADRGARREARTVDRVVNALTLGSAADEAEPPSGGRELFGRPDVEA